MPEITGYGGQIPFSEFQKFRDWFQKTYGIWKAMQYPTNINTIASDPIYQHWVSIGRPTEKVKAAATQADLIQGVREKVTPEGTIPYEGNENLTEYLQSVGWELVESDELGALPSGGKFYRKKEVEKPDPTKETEETNRKLAEQMGISYQDLLRLQQQAPTSWQEEEATRQEKIDERRWLIERSDIASQRDQARWEQQQNRELLAQGGYALRMAQIAGQKQEMSEAEKAEMWQQIRGSLLGSMRGQPASWLDYKQLKLQTNPYGGASSTPYRDTLALRQEQRNTAEAEKNLWQERATAAGGIENLTKFAQQKLEESLDNFEKIDTKLEKAQVNFEKSGEIEAGQPRQIQGGYELGWSAPPPPKPTGVPTPEWLAPYVPGLEQHEQIPGTGTLGGTAPPAVSLSMQQLNKMSDVQRAMHGGYARFAGQDPVELLRQTDITMSKGRRGPTWTPAMQT